MYSMYVCAPKMFRMFVCHWTYRWLSPAIWVQETEPRFPVRAESTLNS